MCETNTSEMSRSRPREFLAEFVSHTRSNIKRRNKSKILGFRPHPFFLDASLSSASIPPRLTVVGCRLYVVRRKHGQRHNPKGSLDPRYEPPTPNRENHPLPYLRIPLLERTLFRPFLLNHPPSRRISPPHWRSGWTSKALAFPLSRPKVAPDPTRTFRDQSLPRCLRIQIPPCSHGVLHPTNV